MIRSIGTKTKLLKMSLEVKKQKAKTKNNRVKYHHTCLSANIFFARRNPPARPCFASYHPPFPCTTPVAGCTIDDARQQLSSHHHHHYLIAIPSSIILIRAFAVIRSVLSSPTFGARGAGNFLWVRAWERLLMCMRKRVSYRNIYPSRIHCTFDVRKKAQFRDARDRKWMNDAVTKNDCRANNVECRLWNVHPIPRRIQIPPYLLRNRIDHNTPHHFAWLHLMDDDFFSSLSYFPKAEGTHTLKQLI